MNRPLFYLAIFASILAISLAVSQAGRAQGTKYGQFAPPDAFEENPQLAYYGSENEWSRRQFSKEKAEDEYKRRGQRLLLATLNGNPNKSLDWAAEYLAEDPHDLESIYNQSIAYCQLGKIDQAFAAMKQAVEGGLPIERFLAGPRQLLKPLTESEEFQEYARSRTSGLLHGPMLGCVTDDSARIWVRTENASPVKVQVFSCDTQGNPSSNIASTSSSLVDLQEDFTAIIELTGLQPNTQYAYDVLIDDQSLLKGDRPHFHTFPEPGAPGIFKVAFGGGAGFMPEHERMWDTISSRNPDALFLLGDNVYIDLPEEPRGLHQYTYYRRQSQPEFRRLTASTPVYAIWDDHDAAMDDVWLGPYLDRPAWKPAMLRIFMENWVNPGYGNQESPGCWFKATFGSVDCFFLETRYLRTNPFGENPTMLGSIEKKWLLNELKNSQARFKVIVSSVPWAPNVKPGSHDTWDGFPHEREEIFGWIEKQKIDGVLLLSADRHRSEAWKIDRPNGYPLYDLMSSKLTNEHTHECVPGQLFCYNKLCSCGMVTFDTTQADPTITYEIVNIDDKVIDTLVIKLSQISF
ncbi:alkaline phosphatase D family protein [Bythopirellula polymerisocia]|uniref:Alkaline phosphatase D n=1 Tax=Bythopirellula polymerisocia TaxID=2528003 RepID=A0A5C6CUI0_9BACT|nr:alkaline phosphatase D family protein [Bythopirellula polymerisocia]TWU27515.1 Alkaline phosphatase D precursor [Bythopirellula polymerisocia]